MRFDNVSVGMHGDPMIPPKPRTILARLRTSAQLAVLVLLVFILKIGAVAACAKYDVADMLSSGTSQATEMRVLAGDSAEVDLTQVVHAGTCSHCGCHHPAAVVSLSTLSLENLCSVPLVRTADLKPSASPPLELRPPIE